jgi:hypothetical protein
MANNPFFSLIKILIFYFILFYFFFWESFHPPKTRNCLNVQACINKMPYESFRRCMLDLSQCLQDNPLPTEQAFNDEYNHWIHWMFIHVEVSENDPRSPPQQGLQESQEVSELQGYQGEYFMRRAHCKLYVMIKNSLIILLTFLLNLCKLFCS